MDPPSLGDSVERLVYGAVALTAAALAEATPGLELTFLQWRALVVLGESTDGARVGEVAARLSGGLPATSRMLRRLERRGLIVLDRDPRDKRATRAELSAEGNRIRRRIVDWRRQRIEALLADGAPKLDGGEAFRGQLAQLAEILRA